MKYKIQYLPAALKDLYKLDRSQQDRVVKAIKKVSKNPLQNYEGGLGKPLGVRGSINLAGYLRIKLKKDGIRVVYKLLKINSVMYIIVIGARSDDEVYLEARRNEKIKR